MSDTNKVTTTWYRGDLMESTNPSGYNLTVSGNNETKEHYYRPKALMLSSLAGCSGADIISLMEKMRLKVDNFSIDIEAELTDEHPRYYSKVSMDFHFHGKNLDGKKLQKAVDLSVDKYCGVMAMFRKFADVTVSVYLH